MDACKRIGALLMATRRAEPGLGRDVAVIAGIRDRDARKGRRFATWRRKKGRGGR